MTSPSRVRRVTADIPGVGGRIRSTPEDFLVEEIPLYDPAGHGEHILFLLEKRGISTFEALMWVSKAAKVSEHVIGYAGLKDARAVTRQWMSVARVSPERLLAVSDARIRVLAAARHPSKLRIGHLKGNRFTINIRGADVSRLRAGREILGRLAERGVPNAYGAQRFGIKEDGHWMGRAILQGEFREFLACLLGRPDPREGDARVRAAREAYDAGDLEEAFRRFPMKHRIQKKALGALLRTADPVKAFEALGKRPRRIYVSAYQSWLFNRCLDARIEASTYDRLLEGDLAWLHRSGALYEVVDAAAEESRAARFESSATGPLWGYDMRRPSGLVDDAERSVIEPEGLSEEAFRADAVRTRGARRPYRVPLADGSLKAEGDDALVARFTLPPGAFATVVLDELMKTGGEAAQPVDPEAGEPEEEVPPDVPPDA